MKKVYHYTSAEGLSMITTSNIFHPSYLNPQMDTAFGEGWYFTDLDPNTTPNLTLEYALWLRSEPVKSKRFLAFEIDESLLEYCRPNVYRLKIATIADRYINLSLTYNYTGTAKVAIRYIFAGEKKPVFKPANNYTYPSNNDFGKFLGFALFVGLSTAILSNIK